MCVGRDPPREVSESFLFPLIQNLTNCLKFLLFTCSVKFSTLFVNGSTICHVTRIMISIKRRTATIPNNWRSRMITCREIIHNKSRLGIFLALSYSCIYLSIYHLFMSPSTYLSFYLSELLLFIIYLALLSAYTLCLSLFLTFSLAIYWQRLAEIWVTCKKIGSIFNFKVDRLILFNPGWLNCPQGEVGWNGIW